MDIQVSVPVVIGGYTGQREQWESFDRHMIVSHLGGGKIQLIDRSDIQKRTIVVNLQELNQAAELAKGWSNAINE